MLLAILTAAVLAVSGLILSSNVRQAEQLELQGRQVDELARQLGSAREGLGAAEAERDELLTALGASRDELEAALAQADTDATAWAADAQTTAEALEQALAQRDEATQAARDAQAKLTQERDALADELTRQREATQAAQDAQAKLTQERDALADELTRQREAAQAAQDAQAKLTQERDALADELTQTQSALALAQTAQPRREAAQSALAGAVQATSQTEWSGLLERASPLGKLPAPEDARQTALRRQYQALRREAAAFQTAQKSVAAYLDGAATRDEAEQAVRAFREEYPGSGFQLLWEALKTK